MMCTHTHTDTHTHTCIYMCVHICVCNDIQLKTDVKKELYSSIRQLDPVIVRLPDGRLALLKDESVWFIDEEGEPTNKNMLSFSAIPLSIGTCSPVEKSVRKN